MDAAQPTARSNWVADEVASLVEVARIHHQHFAFFQKLIWPAVLFAAVILQLSMWQSTEMYHAIPGIYGHTPEILAGTAVRLFGLFADWLFYCFAFAGTAIAVRAILDGEKLETEESLNVVRGAFVRLFVMAFLFFSLLVVLSIGSGFVVGAYAILRHRFGLPYSASLGLVVIWGTIAIGLAVLSRYALAIPALVLENLPFWKCFKRSDELTEGHMLFLAALICESVLGGYVAMSAPFWMWNHVFASRVVLTWTIYWILQLIGLAASAAIQPLMFIGFAYLYITASAPKTPEPAPNGFAVWSAKT